MITGMRLAAHDVSNYTYIHTYFLTVILYKYIYNNNMSGLHNIGYTFILILLLKKRTPRCLKMVRDLYT